MEKSLVPKYYDNNNDLYITHAESQGCFIKIWANFCSLKRTDFEKNVQNYESYTKDCKKLDLFGNKLYVYTLKHKNESRVYRCRIISTDLEAKTHTIVLIDYGRTMTASYSDVREVIHEIDPTWLIDICQKATVYTFLLSTYISKPKSNNDLVNVLCNKYYKYRRDFEVGSMTFISLFDVDKMLIDKGIAENINLATMITIANSMVSTIEFNNKNDMINRCSIKDNALIMDSFLRSQHLDVVTLIDIIVTKVVMDNISLILTVRTLDNESEALASMLNSIDRRNLKLAPVLEVYTPCLIVLRAELVRAIILEVKIDRLYVDLVDYGIKKLVPRTDIFEIPPNCSLIEMRSLNVVLDIPNNVEINQNMFIQKYFQMLPLKIDPNYGLYKVQLFNKNNEELTDVCSLQNSSISLKSQEMFSITEINEEITSIEIKTDDFTAPINHPNSIQIEQENTNMNKKENIDSKMKELIDLEEEAEDEPDVIKEIVPIMFLEKETLSDSQEIIGSLINYISPFNFRVRQYNPNFELTMDHIKSNLDSRCMLKKNQLVKNMYVIYQIHSSSIYRAQIIDMDSEIENIQLQLIDDGYEVIKEHFNKMTLYNFIESDCNLHGQLVLNCSLSDMWFPVINVDTTLMLQPYFKISQLYKILIVRTDECGIKVVQMIEKDTNIDVSNAILHSGIGQRFNAAMKTDENPYEEHLLIGQSFLAYVYNYHFKLCIQPEPNTVNELEEEILKHINENADSELMDIEYLQNTYCLATVDNRQWYRACIKNINEESIIVNMFDISLLTDVPLNQVRPITHDLLRKPQLCLNCDLETKNLDIKITEKTLYNVTVKSINPKGILCINIKEHHSAPLPTPIIRGLEKISCLHVDGDLTYLQRTQDLSKVEKISENLSKLDDNSGSKTFIVPGDVTMFENHGKYYRCVVKSINSKMAVVHCIDFGYEKEIEMKKLQFLANIKIALLPALVIIVKTFPMAFKMSRTMFLANMYMDDNGTLNALPNKMPSIHSQNKLMETLENGCKVKVTCVNSDRDCWIVPHLHNDRLKIISDALIKMKSKIIPAVTEIGSMCAALHSITKNWHRALKLDVNENVLSIDSGERFKALDTTKLVSEIQNIPNCALRCQVLTNVDVHTLLNKDVECKLMSYTRPLLEVQLFTNDMDKSVITSTLSDVEWPVTIFRFDSFNEFYIKKNKYGSNNANVDMKLNSVVNSLEDFIHPPTIGTLVAALTNKNDGVWYKAKVLSNNRKSLVCIIDDGTICEAIKMKVVPGIFDDEDIYFKCCLEHEIEDVNLTDRLHFNDISKIMMQYKWIMKTTSYTEPYKVKLTNNNVDCIDLLYSIFTVDDHDISKNCEIPESDNEALSINVLHGEHAKSTLENALNHTADLFEPEVETVVIKYIKSFQDFYVYSESMAMLYMPQITSDLDLCNVEELPLNDNMVGSIVVTYSFKFSCWCRAKIEKILSNGISADCYLLDSGYYEVCTEFWKPTEFLYLCPPLVRHCSLYAPKLAGQENEIWFPNVNDMFKDISRVEGGKFDMIIKTNGNPCVVALKLADSDVGEMLYPLFVQLTHVKSFNDFKIKAISSDQKCLNQLLETCFNNIDMMEVIGPTVGNLYLAKIKSQLKRVRLESYTGSKYLIIDIDDTWEVMPVVNLYEVPESVRNIPLFCFACSLILDGDEKQYSLNKFQALSSPSVTFIMCIITENDSTTPNRVKLYVDDRDIVDFIKLP